VQASKWSDNYIRWTRIIELDFLPRLRRERTKTIKMNYGMAEG